MGSFARNLERSGREEGPDVFAKMGFILSDIQLPEPSLY
jgi:hypothetical protein